jgi:hemolysin
MKKIKGSPLFHLRPDPLRWSIAGALMLQPLLALGDGIVPVQGPNGSAQVQMHNGIPVVNITAPGPNGLSYNPFNDYNVPVQGLVLNNALAPGDSRLAGALGANPAFQGQAASVILNEVVGQLPSTIAGTQEIFGQAADYVLANPNGIHVQGVGFINTPRAVFLVGTPEVMEGRLTGLNTFSASGDLTISGRGLTTAGAVDLIAPRINSEGHLEATGALTAIAGRNRMAADSLQVLETRQRPDEGPGIDLTVLGAMKAGRIRRVSTREGAGVRLSGPSVLGTQGVTVDSAGDVKVGREGKGRTTVASTQGELALNAKHDITITGSHLAGRAIRAKASRDLTLDTASERSVTRHRDEWKNKTWFVTTETYSNDTEDVRTSLQGTTLTAMTDMALEAGRHVTLKASDVLADNALTISAGGQVLIEGGIETTARTSEIHHRKHLWRGDRTENSMEQKARPSELNARNVSISSAGKTTVRGSDINSQGDLAIQAGSIEIASQAVKRTSSRDDYRGDLIGGWAFGENGEREETGTRQRASHLKAQGTARLVSDDVLIQGSSVHGKAGTQTIGEKGPVIIESVVDVTHVKESRHNSKLAGLVGDKKASTRDQEKVVRSTVTTDGDHYAASATDISIIGSDVAAGGANVNTAKGNVNVLPAKATRNEQSTGSTSSFFAKAGETRPGEDGKAGSKQYEAGVGHKTVTTQASLDETSIEGASLTGRQVHLTADTVTIDSSKVASSEGNVEVDANNLNVVSQLNTVKTTSSESSIAFGEQVTAGIERIGTGHTFERETTTKTTEQATIAQAEVTSSADINFKVGERLHYEGAFIKAEGTLTENAREIERKAVHEIADTQTTHEKYAIKPTLSVEVKDVVKPLMRLATGEDPAKFQQPGQEDSMVPPSLGIDLEATYLSREEGTRVETPTVTSLEGNQIDTAVAGLLHDEGTKYIATEGPVNLTAGRHDALATQVNTIHTLNRTDARTAVRVDTVTGSDINANVNGDAARQVIRTEHTVAVPVAISGKRGVNVQLGTDGLYEGTVFETGEGELRVKTEGDFTLKQAQNRQYEKEGHLDGYVLMKGGTAPAGKNAILMAGANSTTLETTDTQGIGGRIQTPRGQVNAGGTALLQGVNISNGNQATARFDVETGGKAQLLASVNTHQAQGQRLGGALQLGVNRNPAAGVERLGGSIGGHVDMGKVNEHAETRHGATLSIDQLNIKAAAHEDVAIHLEGTQLAGEKLQLDATNGGTLLEAARSEEHKDNLRLTAGAGIGGSSGANKADDASALYGRVKVDLDKVDSTTYKNLDIREKAIDLNAAMNVALKGAVVSADTVAGNIGGDLSISSAQDSVASTQVKVDAQIGKEKNPQGLLNGLKALSGPFAGKVTEQVGKQVQAVDLTVTPTLLVDVVTEQRDTVGKVASLSGQHGINLDVAGDTLLNGAKLRSGQGQVELGGSEVVLHDLNARDYRADVSINASNGPAQLLGSVINEFTASRSEQAKADEHGNVGLIRTGGHDRSQTIKAGVEARQ